MDRNEFQKLLAHPPLPSVLLFEGDDEYLRDRALSQVRSLLLPAGMEELNETLLEDAPADEIIAASETLPFLADQRLVILRDHPALTGRAEAEEKLLNYLPSVPPTTLLLFYCTRKPDGRKKLYTAIKKLNGIVTFQPMKDRELTSFVTDAFRREGRECDERTADMLIFTCGTDSRKLLSEIAKIASHDPGQPVRPEEIELLATPSAECTVFQMVDAVVAHQNSRAFTLMRNQLRAGTDRVFMLSMLLRQFRLLQHVKIMQYEKQPVSAIRSALGVPPFAVEQYLRQASAYTGGQVRDASNLCFETEYAIKSGRLNAEGALEAVMLKLLNIRGKD